MVPLSFKKRKETADYGSRFVVGNERGENYVTSRQREIDPMTLPSLM